MTLNDPLANALSKILTAEKLGKKEVHIFPASALMKNIFELLNTHMYLGGFETNEDSKGTSLTVNLIGNINKCGVIKPRFSVKQDDFERFEKRYLPAKGFGILIVSTSQGLMTHTQAIEKNIGGRLIAYCY